MPTQELNQGLWHYRKILYQLSYYGSLQIDRKTYKFIYTNIYIYMKIYIYIYVKIYIYIYIYI